MSSFVAGRLCSVVKAFVSKSAASDPAAYVSEFFRKQVGVSLREYIIKAKLKLVEIRLLNSDFTLTEIADDLGFTDVSHLSKTFKRYVGTSVREFKNKREYVLLKRAACATD